MTYIFKTLCAYELKKHDLAGIMFTFWHIVTARLDAFWRLSGRIKHRHVILSGDSVHVHCS